MVINQAETYTMWVVQYYWLLKKGRTTFVAAHHPVVVSRVHLDHYARPFKGGADYPAKAEVQHNCLN
jgi:hypothetical protein